MKNKNTRKEKINKILESFGETSVREIINILETNKEKHDLIYKDLEELTKTNEISKRQDFSKGGRGRKNLYRLNKEMHMITYYDQAINEILNTEASIIKTTLIDITINHNTVEQTIKNKNIIQIK